MADFNFVVKNGLVVNTSIVVNSTAIYISSINSTSNGAVLTNNSLTIGNSSVSAAINSTAYSGTANNATNLGGVVAAGYVQNTDSRVMSGNLNFIGANVTFATGFYTGANVFVNTSAIGIGANVVVNTTSVGIGANVVVNTSAIFFGNSVQNSFVNSTGLYVNGVVSAGGGYYKGNKGVIGDPIDANNMFRINSNTVSNNITFIDGENSLAVGPITIGTGNTITISTGSRVVII